VKEIGRKQQKINNKKHKLSSYRRQRRHPWPANRRRKTHGGRTNKVREERSPERGE